MSVNEALKTIYEKRQQVSPSMRQFNAIERYRKEHCPDASPLNPHSDIFKPFRKDAGAYLTSDFTQGAMAFLGLMAVFGTGFIGLPVAMVGGVMASMGAKQYKEGRDEASKDAAKSLEDAAPHSFTSEQRLAFQYGFYASQGWGAWASACSSPTAYQHQQHYAAGVEAGKENDMTKLRKYGMA